MIDEIFRDMDGLELGETVVDIGAGWGTATRYLLSRGLAVVAVDVDPGAAARLRDALGVEACVATAEALPFRDNAFDTAISVAALHHVANVEAALREAARVAKRLAAIYDWTPEAGRVTNPHSPSELRRKMDEAALAAEKLGYTMRRVRLWYRLIRAR